MSLFSFFHRHDENKRQSQTRITLSLSGSSDTYGIKHQHLTQQVNDFVRRLRRQRVQGRQRRRFRCPPQHVRLGALAGVLHVLQGGSPQQFRDEFQLLHGVLRLKQYPTAQQFPEYTTHGPHVDGSRVVLRAHQDLGGPVVLRHHLLGHVLARVGFFYSR